MIEMSDGIKVARKRLIARNLWQAVTLGKMTFPDGNEIQLSPDDILALTQFLYKHIDGPPPAAVDVTSGGEKIAQFDYEAFIRNFTPRPDGDSNPSGKN
jgi:hypothetical protein